MRLYILASVILFITGCQTTHKHELEVSYKTLLCSVSVKYKGEVR